VADAIPKKTVVVLDNARIHHARDVRAKQPQWAEKGLEFFFLPPYSPELNPIEIVWKKAKHFWLPFTELSNSELEDRLSDILGGFGSTYTVTFC
jgi:transposase